MIAEFKDKQHTICICPNCGKELKTYEIDWQYDEDTESESDYLGYCPHCNCFLEF